MAKNDGGAAFPVFGIDTWNGQTVQQVHQRGMSLRDHFAAKAMQGFVSCGVLMENLRAVSQAHGVTDDKVIARFAYDLADAMLKARDA